MGFISSHGGRAWRGLVLLLVLLSALSLAGAEARDRRTVKVAFYPEPVMCEKTSSGRRTGIAPEWLYAIVKRTGWQIEWVDTTFPAALQLLREGKVDLVPGVLLSENREFLLSHVPAGIYRLSLYARATSAYRPDDMEQWNGMTIGVVREYTSIARLREELGAINVKHVMREYESIGELEAALMSGECDAVLSDATETLRNARVLLSLSPRPWFFAAKDGNRDILDELDYAASALLCQDPDYLVRLRRVFYPDLSGMAVPFSRAEREWIRRRIESGLPIRVDVSPLLPPFKTWDEDDDRPSGLANVILNEITASTGLQFEYAPPTTHEAAEERFLAGEVDLWFLYGGPARVGQTMAGEVARVNDIRLPQVYCTHRGVHVSKPFSQRTFAVWREDIERVRALTREVGASLLVLKDTREDCFRALVADEVDGVVCSFHNARLLSSKLNISDEVDIQTMSFARYEPSYAIAVGGTGSPLLASAISRIFGLMPRDRLNDMMYRAAAEHELRPFLSGVQVALLLLGVLLLALLLFVIHGMFARRRLQEALRAAEKADRAKSRFLATMSHEIRTPLNSVIGFAEFLRRPGVTPAEMDEYTTGIARSSYALLALINDILDLSKLDAGCMEVRVGECDLRRLAGEIISIFAPLAKKKGLRLRKAVSDAFPVLRLSEQCMRQVLLNLVGNSVKFTEHGGVQVAAVVDDVRDDTCDLRLIVSDTGTGISPDKLPQVFDPFVQDGSVRGGNVYKGTGLGLPIVKRMVESGGGRITVESHPGRGTVFVIDIPAVEIVRSPSADASVQRPVSPAGGERFDGAGRSVLVVDDVPMNLRILAIHLKGIGFTDIRTAESGAKALELVRERRPDVVLTDMWMPGMDGSKLSAAVRCESGCERVPVVAVTADADTGATFDLSGFAAVLTKPVTAAKLQELFASLAWPDRSVGGLGPREGEPGS